MRTIAILNLKGGVGKTITAINTAAILARDYQQRVLLIDADSQCNLTEFVGGKSSESNLAEVLRSETPAVDSIQRSALDELVDILPGDNTLMDLDLTKVETGSVRATVLRDLVRELRDADRYDACIVDSPPAFNAASAAALIAADDVVVPIKLDAFSLRGMTNVLRQIQNMRAINAGLRLAGLLPTMWHSSEIVTEAMRTLRDFSMPVFSPIRRSDKVDESTFAQEALPVFSPRSAAGVDYRKFVAELLQGGATRG